MNCYRFIVFITVMLFSDTMSHLLEGPPPPAPLPRGNYTPWGYYKSLMCQQNSQRYPYTYPSSGIGNWNSQQNVGGYPIVRESWSPENKVQRLSPGSSIYSSPCPAGQQYVYLLTSWNNPDKKPSLCLGHIAAFMPCRCQPGCRHKHFFIPYGTSIVVDKCGNKCTCKNPSGQAECGFDSC